MYNGDINHTKANRLVVTFIIEAFKFHNMNIGLVLSGGGVRAAAHIGVIKALEEHGLYPTHIAGTSAGAIVGALYAHGYTCDEMMLFFKNVQILDFKKYALNKPGFIDSEKYYAIFNQYFPVDDFSSLNKKMVITATDILEGKLKTFSEGELINPIIASATFPGVFAPIKIDGSYYIDGGVLNNFPVEFVKDSCETVIGVHVNPIRKVKIKELKHFHNILERAFKLKSTKDDLSKFKDCDLTIYPEELSKYGTFDKKYLNEIYEIGYNSAKKKLKNSSLLKIGKLKVN